MKQQAGIGILLALTTAICWGVANRNEQVLEVMEPSDNRVLPFLDGEYWPWCHSCGEEEVAAITRVSQFSRWLILLAVATAGLFGNFILFSSSLQYLSPTASQVIGQLSPVGIWLPAYLS
ncbi:Transporter [Escherichia coli]|nr:Transporter [Escherichia coli]